MTRPRLSAQTQMNDLLEILPANCCPAGAGGKPRLSVAETTSWRKLLLESCCLFAHNHTWQSHLCAPTFFAVDDTATLVGGRTAASLDVEVSSIATVSAQEGIDVMLNSLSSRFNRPTCIICTADLVSTIRLRLKLR